MSTVWVSSAGKDTLLREHARSSWLLSRPRDPQLGERVLLLVHTQDGASNLVIRDITLTQKEAGLSPGLGRQGSQPGFAPLPRGAPSLAKSLSHSGAKAGEAEEGATVAALRHVQAQAAGEHAWFASVPLPFSLYEDSADLWGPDAMPLMDKAKLGFTVEVQNSRGGTDLHVCSMEVDSQCHPSLVGVVAILRTKCDGSTVLASCLQSTMQLLPWLAIHDVAGVQSAYWLYATICSHFAALPVYLAPVEVDAALATLAEFLTNTSTVWGTAPAPHAALFVLVAAFEMYDAFGRSCTPSEVNVPVAIYHLLQPLADSNGCQVLREAIDKKAAKDLMAATFRFAITEGLTFLRRSDSFKIIPDFTSWAALVPIFTTTDLGEKAHMSYADDGLFERIRDCHSQLVEGAGSRAIRAFIQEASLTNFSDFSKNNSLFLRECMSSITLLREAVISFRAQTLFSPRWQQLYQAHFGAESSPEDVDSSFHEAHDSLAQVYEAHRLNSSIIADLRTRALVQRRLEESWQQLSAVKDLDAFRNGKAVISLVAGTGEKGLQDTTMALSAVFNQPCGIASWPHGDAGRFLICDSGNSRICWLTRPQHSYDLNLSQHSQVTPVCGTGQGNTSGEFHTCKFFRPRSVCANPHHVDHVLICDTNNHCIKLADVHNLRVMDLSTSSRPGFKDGAADAAFRFPVHIIAYPVKRGGSQISEFVVCDRGNHALRRLEMSANNRIKVTTLAGGPSLQGLEDGRISKARLKAPVGAVVRESDGCIFFIEQGNASLRMLDQNQVTTLFAGEPFDSPSCVCFGDTQDVLLIGDAGAQTIWQFNVTDRSVTPLVTAEDLPRVDDKLVFRPAGIVAVDEGCFLVSDSSRHQVFRFFSHNGAARAAANFAEQYEAQLQNLELFSHNLEMFRNSGVAVVDRFSAHVGKICSVKYQLLSAALRATVPFHNTLCDREAMSADAITQLIAVMPSIETASALLQGLRVPRNVAHVVRLAIQGLCKRCSLMLSSIDHRRELQALYELRLSLGPDIVDQEVLAAVFAQTDFAIVMDDAILQILELLLGDVRWSFDRDLSGELRTATVRWLARTYGSWSLAQHSHSDILQNVLRTWNEINVSTASSLGNSFERTLKWLMRVHMDSVMQGQVNLKAVVIEDGEEKETTRMLDRSLLTLEHLAFLSNLPHAPLTLAVLVEEVTNVLGSVASASALKAIFESGQDIAGCNLLVFNQLFQPALFNLMDGTYKSIMHNLERALEVRRQKQQERYEKQQQKKEREGKPESKSGKSREPKHYEDNLQTVRPWDIRQELLRDTEMWGQAIHWVLNDACADMRDAKHPIWPQLQQTALDIAQMLGEGAQEALVGVATVDATKKLVHHHEHLRAIWDVIMSPLADDTVIHGIDAEMQSALVELQLLKKVLTVFMPESLELYTVQDAINRWNQLQLRDYRTLLRLNSAFSFASDDEVSSVDPLPEHTLLALDWLSQLTSSKAFSTIWESLADTTEANYSRLVPAAVAWRQWMLDLYSGALSFPLLDAIAQHLVVVDELQLLLKTTTALSPEDSVFEVASTVSPNVSQLHGQIQDWLHVRKVLNHREDLAQTLELLPSFVDISSCAMDIQRVTQSFNDLCQTVDALDWDELKLQDLPRFWIMAQHVDARLVRVNPRLLKAVMEHKEAVDWLRLLANDLNFTNGLEMAFGKTEMECPIELWDDKHGRVDEQKLSILRNVRSYLHSFLYTQTSHFQTLERFMHVFSGLNAAVEVDVIVQNIAVVQQNLAPLIAIITDDSETAGPNRLVHLYHPSKQARWICRKDVGDQAQVSSLILQYLVVSREGDTRWQEHKLDELLDFQSSIVLARTNSMNAVTVQQVIDSFLFQFSWVRQIAGVLDQLQVSGHFDFSPSYNFQLSVATDLQQFKDEMQTHAELLREWETTIDSLRSSLYYLNFAGSAQLQAFARNIANNSLAPMHLQPVICRINCDLSHDKAFLEQSLQRAVSVWESQQLEVSAGTAHAVYQLIKAAHVLNAVLAQTPVRVRRVQLELAELSSNSQMVSRGVHVALAASANEQYKTLLTLYAQLGTLPEWKEILICKPDTRKEQVMNFMRRWRGSGELKGFTGYFIVLGVEELPFDLQQCLSQSIREYSAEALLPLVLIAYHGISNHVISQHMHNKLFVPVLLDSDLRRMGEELSATHSLGLAAYTSINAGAGKTFDIRIRAHTQGMTYVHIPIHSDVKERTLIERVDANCAHAGESSRLLLHLDLSSSVTSNFNHMVFKLGFLGFIAEEDSGDCFVWDPKHTALMFELASGALKHKLNVIDTMANVVSLACGENFCVAAPELAIGMGEDFSSPRYDGSNEGSNAFERLEYVAYALKLFDSLKGGFPYQYEGPSADAVEVLDPREAFQQITEASGQADRPSLWCIWNFVNVLFWQIKDLHHPESVLNTACMPDPSSHSLDDKASKERIKGELLLFIFRTAKEFATRQSKRSEAGQIISVTVRNMSRTDFNGYWRRTGYDNDGQPCFTTRAEQFYLYFRRLENRWVIDDIIEPTGPVYSCSTTKDIHGRWTTSPTWQNNSGIRAELKHSTKGYQNEAYRIYGCASCGQGGSVSADEDGLYIRQPPYDNINERPHYIKEEPRRHLFYNISEHCWQISPVCNEDQGAYAMTNGQELSPGRWRVIPPDIQENGQSFVFSETGEYAVPDNAGAGALLDGAMQFDLLHWKDTNHECVLFSNESHMVSFLSMNAKQMRSKMHPGLLRHLEQNNIVVGEELSTLGARHHAILRSVTGVERTDQETRELMGGKYCLTGDNMLKMLAIYYRVRCGIPVVLMGECGCGKTMLISYLCAWLGVELLVLDVHGGTTERDILAAFENAEKIIEEDTAQSIDRRVFVFLDEVNTCAHMGLITEAICRRTLNGNRMNERIQVLAALNPYRLRSESEANQGLTFSLPGKQMTPDPMSRLVYRVHPVPETLQEFIFDFGALETDTELLYIRSMVNDKLRVLNDTQRLIIADLVQASHDFVRATVGDDSAVSLRDVKRFLQLAEWFDETMKVKAKQTKILPIVRACMLALAHVYSYRLSSSIKRNSYWSRIRMRLHDWGKDISRSGFGHLTEPGALQSLVERAQRRFSDNLDVEDGIALNQALMENLFVVIVCILNKIPVFVVGKPGSSKTLTMQVIASNLQGKQSKRAIWRQFPAVYIFQYQCSPLSTTASIKFQYDAAVSYQSHSQDVITVLLLDEVGLAEHSPDMPLKVLHYILVAPPISVVGLSNWELDPAKMNRAVCLQRPEPSPDDIMLTGSEIVNESGGALQSTPDAAPALKRQNSEGSRMDMKLKAIAEAFHTASRTQEGREFIGMRDYYQLLKLLRKELKHGADFDSSLLTYAVSRNFGGKPKLLHQILKVFHKHCFGADLRDDALQSTSVLEAIRSNLRSHDVRHLMVLTRNDTALSLLFGCGVLQESDVEILVGSRFREDLAELHLVQQINQVKQAMAAGRTIVLLNHDNIYEALYDVLNQRYVFTTDEDGTTKKMLRLAVGPRSQLCPVLDSFKIVVIVDQSHAYDNLDLPLLNRFEKQLFVPQDLLKPSHHQLLQELSAWIAAIEAETGLPAHKTFCGFYQNTLPSLLLELTDYGQRTSFDADAVLRAAKHRLRRVAMPVAVMFSSLLQDTEFDYFEAHANLSAFLTNDSRSEAEAGSFWTLMTYSPIYHFECASDGWNKTVNDSSDKQVHGGRIQSVMLAELASERHLARLIADFLQDTSATACSTLAILADPATCSQALINHARHMCVQQHQQLRAAENSSGTNGKSIMFVIHLPPGISSRARSFVLDFNRPWKYAFVDDLRSESEIGGPKISTLLQQSVSEMFTTATLPLVDWVQEVLQPTLVRCATFDWNTALRPDPRCSTHPGQNDPSLQSYSLRVSMLRVLIADPTFFEVFQKSLMSCFEFKSHRDRSGMHLHVAMACKDDAMAGSLRQSLHLAVQSVVSQALGHVIRQLDKNGNLAWLFGCVKHAHGLDMKDPGIELWIRLWRVMVDTESIGRTFVLVMPGDPAADITVPNTSRFEPLICQFPFSDQLVHAIGNSETRKQVEAIARDVSSAGSSMHAIAEAIVGSDIVRQWSVCFPSGHHQYFHDMIAISLHPCPSLPFEMHFKVCDMLMTAVAGDFLASPAHIHAAFWASEQVIFHTLSLLSICERFTNEIYSAGAFAPLQPAQLVAQFDVALRETAASQLSSMTANATNVAVQLVAVVVAALRESLQNLLGKEKFDDRMWLWPHITRMVHSDVCNLLSYIASSDSIDRTFVIDVAFQPWWSIAGCDVVLREMASGIRHFHNVVDQTLEVFLQHDLFSADLLERLVELEKAFEVHSSARWGRVVTSFIVDCLDIELRRLANTPLAITLDPALVRALLHLAHRIDSMDDTELSPVATMMTKAVLGIFNTSHAYEQIEGLWSDVLQSNVCAQLVMDQCDDLGVDAHEVFTDGDEMDIIRSDDYSQQLTAHGKRTVTAILQVKKAILSYAQTIVTALNNDAPLPRAPAGIVTQVLMKAPLPAAQQYYLNCIQKLGSTDALIAYFVKQSVPVLPNGCTLLTSVKTLQTIDPFERFGNEYAGVCATILSQSLNTGTTMSSRQAQLHLSALFTQLTRQGQSIAPMFVVQLNRTLKNLPVATRVLQWLARGCPRSVSVDAGAQEQKQTEPSATTMLQDQVTLHAAMLCMDQHAMWEWLAAFMCDIPGVARMYLPSMVDDEMAAIIDAAGYVGWYKCPNGHPYSVGNCTYPMETARCSVDGCGALIGGSNHVAVNGVTRFDNTDNLAQHKKGYDPLTTLGTQSYALGVDARGTAISCQLLRYVIHSVMLVSVTTASASDVHQGLTVASIMFPDSQKPSLSRACKEIEHRRQQDWEALLQSTGLTPVNLALFMQMVMFDMPRYHGDVTTNPSHRLQFENTFASLIHMYIGSAAAQDHLAQASKRYGDESRVQLLVQALGQHWPGVNEVPTSNSRSALVSARLWKYRERVSVELLRRWFSFDGSAANSYPLLSAVLKEEHKLPRIKHLVDILAWHRVLFNIFRPGSISREEASTITNAEALAMVPELERAQATTIFEAFCVAFNSALPLVTNLYECQANPFLNKDGEVDLSGAGNGNAKMGFDTPISFSLPSLVQGDADASGLCTIQMVNVLQETHNQLLRTLQAKAELVNVGMPVRLARRRRNKPGNARSGGAEVKAEDHDGAENSPLESLPVTTYLTPTTLVRSKLVDYDRDRHLLPLIHTFVLQLPQLRGGMVNGFDFEHIQASLALNLLGSATPIVVHVRHFQFAGELRKTGGLRGLAARVPQESVNKSVLDNIWTEIDTQNRLTRLMAQLEECIAFVVSIGGSGSQEISGRMRLEDFLLKVLLVDPGRWEEIACPTLQQNISLCHLQALFMDLEERVRGNPADNVVLKYREQLGSELQKALLAKSSSIDLSVFLPLLRDFMTEQLCTDTWPAEAPLKEYLTYASEIDLDALDWFVDLPDGLELRHAYATYHVVKNGGVV